MTHKFDETTQHGLDALLIVFGKVKENWAEDWEVLRHRFPDLDKGYKAIQEAYAIVKEDSE